MRAGDLVYTWSDSVGARTYSDEHMSITSALGRVPGSTPVVLIKQIRDNCWSALINGQSVFIYQGSLSMATDSKRRHDPVKMRNL
jgi:hypothetical protein